MFSTDKSYCKDCCSSEVNSSTYTFMECIAVILKSAPVGFLNIAETEIIL